MRLTDLDARFLGPPYKDADKRTCYDDNVSIADAAGVMFQCPKCAEGKEVMEEDGRRFVVGAHSVICWFVGKVPDDLDPKPGRWHPSGTGLHDLTFVGPGAASVLLTSGCGWHGFVKDGDAS
jgi:predicted RNA-binding Zn-ribbon protein involved in translation (DUF1610 family)